MLLKSFLPVPKRHTLQASSPLGFPCQRRVSRSRAQRRVWSRWYLSSAGQSKPKAAQQMGCGTWGATTAAACMPELIPAGQRWPSSFFCAGSQDLTEPDNLGESGSSRSVSSVLGLVHTVHLSRHLHVVTSSPFPPSLPPLSHSCL